MKLSNVINQVLLLGALMTGACDKDIIEPDPLLEGAIVEVAQTPFSVLVNSPPLDCMHRFLFDTNTRIERALSNGTTESATKEELQVGKTVIVWVDAPYQTTCPALALATKVVIKS